MLNLSLKISVGRVTIRGNVHPHVHPSVLPLLRAQRSALHPHPNGVFAHTEQLSCFAQVNTPFRSAFPTMIIHRTLHVRCTVRGHGSRSRKGTYSTTTCSAVSG